METLGERISSPTGSDKEIVGLKKKKKKKKKKCGHDDMEHCHP